jgi:hypothetical protein
MSPVGKLVDCAQQSIRIFSFQGIEYFGDADVQLISAMDSLVVSLDNEDFDYRINLEAYTIKELVSQVRSLSSKILE